MKSYIVRLLAVVVSVTAVCLITLSSVSARSGPNYSKPWLSRVVMTSAKTGWGTSPAHVLKTMDGGRTWRTVLAIPNVSTVAIGGPHVLFASIGLDTAWAVIPSAHGLRTYRTVNGGVTWAYSHQPFAGENNTWGPQQLVFADPQHGWLLLHDGVNSNSRVSSTLGTLHSRSEGSLCGIFRYVPHEILRTSDGGRVWTRIEYALVNNHTSRRALPPCDDPGTYLSFINAKIGLATCTCGAKHVFRTEDGGRMWRQEAMPAPMTDSAPGQLTVVGPHKILLLPVALDSPPAFVLYRSIDGGLSWKPTTAIGSSSDFSPNFSPLSNLTSWVELGPVLRRTTDGGIRWYVMTKKAPFIVPPQLDFVNKSDGFALSPTGGSHHLWVTTDSGRHWCKIIVGRS